MQTIKSLLVELDAVLKQYNTPEYKKLQPPLPDSDIDKFLQEIGIHDENIKALFQWKNGEKEDSYCQMMNYGGMQSLEIIKEWRMIDRPFDQFLIEIITDNGEESLLFNNKKGPYYGMIYIYSIGLLYIEHPISYFDSLTSMIKTTIEAYKTKAFKYDKEDNWLDIDFKKYSVIAKKYNKKSAYWKKHDRLQWEEWYAI